MPEVDLVVIGTGPGGESFAHQALRAGYSVTAVESRLVGGECPYYGCMPAKVALRGAHAVADVRRVPAVGGAATVAPDWSIVAHRIADDITADWDDEAAADRLRKAGGDLVRGHGRLIGPNRVLVHSPEGGEIELTARVGVLLNPGTRPSIPPIEGLEGTPYLTNREAVALTELPRDLIVLGGGPIGVEFGQTFGRFGVKVTIVEPADRVLPRDEPEGSELLAAQLKADGIRVLTATSATRVEHAGDLFTLTLDSGETLSAEQFLVAAGRTPNLDNLGLESLGLNPEQVEVDSQMKIADSTWLVGDAAGHGAYTHLAIYQAQVALAGIVGQAPLEATYHAVPHVTFTEPEVAGVGHTEASAAEAGLDVVVGSADIGRSSRAATYGPGSDGVIKVILDRDGGYLVGASITGPGAAEMIAMLVLAVHAKVPATELASMIYAYPTFHRTIQTAIESAVAKATR